MESLSNAVGVLAGTLARVQSPKLSGKTEYSMDFDSMVRGRYEQADGQKTQEQPENEQKDAATEETKDDSQAPKESTQEKTEAVKEPEKLEDMKQRYELAAALMFQNQPEYVDSLQQTVEVQQTESAVEAMPEVVEQAVMPETVESKQAEVTVAAHETPEVLEAPEEAVKEVSPQQEMPAEEERGGADTDTDTVVEAPKVQAKEVSEEDTVEVPEEAPVFGEVEAAPVKVAEAPVKPMELEAQDALEQLSERIEIPQEEGTSTAVIELAPESLGKLTVQITRSADGTLSVLFHASTSKAAEVLEQHSSGLQNMLALKNDAEVRIEVRGGEENRQQFLDPNGRNNQQGQQQNQQQQEHGEPQKEHRVTDFIQQLRLGLVDVDGRGF